MHSKDKLLTEWITESVDPSRTLRAVLRAYAKRSCDGVPRYTVQKTRGLTYTQAREAILSEGGGLSKRLARLTQLNKMHERFLKVAA